MKISEKMKASDERRFGEKLHNFSETLVFMAQQSYEKALLSMEHFLLIKLVCKRLLHLTTFPYKSLEWFEKHLELIASFYENPDKALRLLERHLGDFRSHRVLPSEIANKEISDFLMHEMGQLLNRLEQKAPHKLYNLEMTLTPDRPPLDLSTCGQSHKCPNLDQLEGGRYSTGDWESDHHVPDGIYR